MSSFLVFQLFGFALFLYPFYLQAIQPSETSLLETISKWDKKVSEILQKFPLEDSGGNRLWGYLLHAQNEAIIQGIGSIDEVSLHVIQLFYPDRIKTPPFDKMVSLDRRFFEEESQIHSHIISIREGGWVGTFPFVGLKVLSWRPWVLKSADEFRLPVPPSSEIFWKEQLGKVKQAMKEASEGEKQRILFWAGIPSYKEGNWRVIVNEYMRRRRTPLMTQIKVRNALGKAIVDANIASFDSKYAYVVKRPNMLDPNLKTYIDTPNHPSFPSGHSTVGAAVVEVLNHFFPENSFEWKRLLEEAGRSRILAGIHFPIDKEAGEILGRKVGQAICQRINRED